jgi:hypothetical protein
MAEEFKQEIEQDKGLSPIEELRKRIEDLEMNLGALNPRNLAGIRRKDLRQAVATNFYGDGSDGDVVISTNTTLTRDMFYNNLIINNGVTLKTNGFRIFVKETLTNRGTIACNGGNGENGHSGNESASVKGLGGNGGDPAGIGSIAPMLGGCNGGNGRYAANNPSGFIYPEQRAGQSGTDRKSIGSPGVGGGGAGSAPGSMTGGPGGNGGSVLATYNYPNSFFSTYSLFDVSPTVSNIYGSLQSGGGGGGDAQYFYYNSCGGGGGGSGAPGGIVAIFAKKIINDGIIEAKGGNGGNGGNGLSGTGGGGGGGGSGGVIILTYLDFTGSGSLDVSGGAGGSGGTGGGSPGSPGQNGNEGVIIKIQL